MDRRTLVGTLRNRTHYTTREVCRFLDILSEILQGELAAGGQIYLRGIGRFTPHQAGPWQSRDPRTKEPMVVPAKWRVKFTPCPALRDKVEHSPKLYKEDDLLKKYGLDKEEDDGKVRSPDRPKASRERKARKRFPWD
jgi:nucleoid DNA-binding protein